jgi:GNAT superfamily N-acetyltransferase
MCDRWMPTITLPLSWEQFHQLPRNPAYRYEYLEGKAHLSPRPKHYHALLELRPMEPDGSVAVEPVRAEEVPALAPVFAAAFHDIQPFGSLDDDTRMEAARQALERACGGGDGPWIQRASFVARSDGRAVGAILITLLPAEDPCDWDTYYWKEPPPADCIERRLGRPHLTWVFVAPVRVGRGVGTALLAAAGRELLDLGYTELLSTFMLGNESSMLWHWRNGFRLLTHPGSLRRFRRDGRPPAI